MESSLFPFTILMVMVGWILLYLQPIFLPLFSGAMHKVLLVRIVIFSNTKVMSLLQVPAMLLFLYHRLPI